MKKYKIVDPVLGDLAVQYDRKTKLYYLESEGIISDYESVLLSVESKSINISNDQYKLIDLIRSKFSLLIEDAYEYLAAKLIEISDEYTVSWSRKRQLETVFIPCQDIAHLWELYLLNPEDGFTYYVIEFDEAKPFGLATDG